jgi:hypothetical protein
MAGVRDPWRRATNPTLPRLIVGLPHVRPGPILDRARAEGYPVLISVNALADRQTLGPSPFRPGNVTEWQGWKLDRLHLLDGMDAYLDSSGFVAMARYRGFEFSPASYIGGPCKAHPWRWFAAMDLCVEPELAPGADDVLDRIAGTVNLYHRCRREAERHGIADRLLPVVQGWHTDDYLRCLDRLNLSSSIPMIGVGSTCRRNRDAVTQVADIVRALDDALAGTDTRLHLFGVKSEAAAAVADCGRVATIDSQAYGTAARWDAKHGGFSKTDAFVADTMRTWATKQERLLESHRPAVQLGMGLDAPTPRLSAFEQRLSTVREEFRRMVEAGELDHDDINPAWVYEAAGWDDDSPELIP